MAMSHFPSSFYLNNRFSSEDTIDQGCVRNLPGTIKVMTLFGIHSDSASGFLFGKNGFQMK